MLSPLDYCSSLFNQQPVRTQLSRHDRLLLGERLSTGFKLVLEQTKILCKIRGYFYSFSFTCFHCDSDLFSTVHSDMKLDILWKKFSYWSRRPAERGLSICSQGLEVLEWSPWGNQTVESVISLNVHFVEITDFEVSLSVHQIWCFGSVATRTTNSERQYLTSWESSE